MCFIVICSKCKKFTWSGCGKHLEEIFRGVDEKKICKCKSNHHLYKSNHNKSCNIIILM